MLILHFRESSQPSQGSLTQASRPNGHHASIPVAGNSISATNGKTAAISREKPFATKDAAVKGFLEKPIAGQSATNGSSKSAASGKTSSNGLNSTSKNGITTNGNVSSSHSTFHSSNAPSSQPTKGQPLSRANGVSSSREALQSKESNKDVTRPTHPPYAQYHALPKKPVTAAAPLSKAGNEASKSSLSTSDTSSQPASKKRPSPLPDHAPAEKRAKINHSGTPSTSNHSRTPSNPYNPARKPDPSGLPPKPKVSAGPTSNPSPRPGTLGVGLGLSSTSKAGNKDVRKLGGTPRPGNSKAGTPRSDTPRSDMTRDLPPPLSPLHPNFESSPLSEPPTSSALSNLSKNKKQEEQQSSAKKTVDKGKAVVRRQNQRSESPAEASDRVSRPLPPLLSPDLPAVVEEALNEVKNQKKTFATVEQRHELARQDGAPGVARIVKTKSSRKTVAAPEPDTQDEPEDSEDSHRLTTLKFKKKSREPVKWITKSRPQPGRGLTNKPLPAAFILRLNDTDDDEENAPVAKTNITRKKRPDDDEDDVPLAKTTIKKKRPADSSTSEPAPKRVKAEVRDITRTSAASSTARKSTPVPAGRNPTPVPAGRKSTPIPAAKASTPVPSARLASPAPSAPSNKSLLATPKRGDAMRSVAMRKVDSSEGLARTPQPNMTCTPGSVDRSRMNPTSEPRSQHKAEIEKLNSEANSSSVLALKLKRKMDEILKIKNVNAPRPDTKDRKQGLATGIESVTAYMNCFYRTDRATTLAGKPHAYENWIRIYGLATFLERECAEFPVLHALACQLGAICFDHLERSYLELKEPTKRLENWDAMEKNNKLKNRFWHIAEEKKSLLEPFSGGQTLGPWSDIKDITTHTIGIITAYSRKEQSGWKKDPEFSSLLT